MIDLEKFLEPIELAGTPLQDHRAYRMDGESPQPDMRKDVGLGPCNCCDYFLLSKDDTIILIEETKTYRSAQGFAKRISLSRKHRSKAIYRQVHPPRKSIKGLWVSACIMSPICGMPRRKRSSGKQKSYKFWLVVSGMNETQGCKIFSQSERSFIQ